MISARLPLSIACVTRCDDAVVPTLRGIAAHAWLLGAEFVVGADGPGADDRLDAAGIFPSVVMQVKSSGLQEHVQDRVIRYCHGDYVLCIDDDEGISDGMMNWLGSRQYVESAAWRFRRAWLYPDAGSRIVSAPHWPDYQVRLCVHERAHGWHGGIHPSYPHADAATAPDDAVILHHKLLIRSLEERREQVKLYDSFAIGAGLPIFYLPEDRETEIMTEKVRRGGEVEDVIERSGAIGMPMQQHGDEILGFLRWYLELHDRPVRVLEIGTGHGGTAALWCEVVVTDQAQVISVDIPLGIHGGLAPADVLLRNRRLKERYPQFHAIQMDSQLDSTRDEVLRVMGGMFDLLFIDGDHRYECARRDFELYSPLVRHGGVILLHDIEDTPFYRGLNVNVRRLWDELEGDKVEFNIHHPEWGGLGAISNWRGIG